MVTFADVFGNRIFMTMLLAVFLSQFIKLISAVRDRDSIRKTLFASGGMPSTHSSLVSALASAVFFTEGLSTLFFVTLALAFIVIDDAVGVRRTAGEEGNVINKIIRAVKLRLSVRDYAKGHTPLQAFMGILLGIVCAVFIFSF